MSRICGACSQSCGTAHECEACGSPLHSWIMCEKVWMPTENKYFCGKRCVIAYNERKEKEYAEWLQMLPNQDEAEGTAPKVIEVRRRDGEPIEQPRSARRVAPAEPSSSRVGGGSQRAARRTRVWGCKSADGWG